MPSCLRFALLLLTGVVAAACDATVAPDAPDVAAIAAATAPTSKGVVSLEGTKVPASGKVRVRVVDADPNVDPTLPDAVHVYVTSDGFEGVVRGSLVETGNDTGVFEGEIPENGTIEMEHDDRITVTYRDQNYADTCTCSPGFPKATAAVDAVSADLTIPSGSLLFAAAPLAGASFHVSGAVANDARGADAGPFTVRAYLHRITEDDEGYEIDQFIEIGTTTIGGLSAGATTPFEVTGTLQENVNGEFHLRVLADSGYTVDEWNEDNNGSEPLTVGVVGADLTVPLNAVNAPSTVVAGHDYAITAAVLNTHGAATAGESTACGSLRRVIEDAEGHEIDQIFHFPGVAIASLGQAASQPFPLSMRIDDNIDGTFKLYVNADCGFVVAESNELNNSTLVGEVRVFGADLTLDVAPVQSNANPGDVLQISGFVNNAAGAADAPPSTVRVSLYRTIEDDEGYEIEERYVLGTKDIGSIPGGPLGGSAPIDPFGVTIPSGISGTFTLMILADAGGQVAESNEQNNGYLQAMTVH
jgi:hypothetical protein